MYRHLILPASLPSFVAGLKQGWAFAWRSLMAGELLVIIMGQPSIGVLLSTFQDQSAMTGPDLHHDRDPGARDRGRHDLHPDRHLIRRRRGMLDPAVS